MTNMAGLAVSSGMQVIHLAPFKNIIAMRTSDSGACQFSRRSQSAPDLRQMLPAAAAVSVLYGHLQYPKGLYKHGLTSRLAAQTTNSQAAECIQAADFSAASSASVGAPAPDAASTASASVSDQQQQVIVQQVGLGAPFASLSRVLLASQPNNIFRNFVTNKKWPSTAGPLSVLLVLFGTVIAILAALRASLVKRVKNCKCCRGFGVVRCKLCDGKGSVDWRAKFSYSENCPLCLSKRFVDCSDCGGHYHRGMFGHSPLIVMPSGAAAPGTTSRPLD